MNIELSQKAKQYVDNSTKGILGLSQEEGGGINNIFFLSSPLPFQAFRKWWYLPHCYLVIELGWTSEKRKKNSDLKYQNIFLAKSNNIAKQKTSLQDLCNMLPFINGNLDRYFFCSFAIFFLSFRSYCKALQYKKTAFFWKNFKWYILNKYFVESWVKD